jgi:hypothetical protein
VKEESAVTEAPQTPYAIKFKNTDAAFRFYLEFKDSVAFRVDGLLTLILPARPEIALKQEPATYRILKDLEANGLAREVALAPARGEARLRTHKDTREALRQSAKERPQERAFLERLRTALGERPKSAKGGSGGS